MRSGGINMEMVAQVPAALVLVVQAIVILILAGSTLWLSRKGEKV